MKTENSEKLFWDRFSTPWGDCTVVASKKGLVRFALPGHAFTPTPKKVFKRSSKQRIELKRASTPAIQKAKKEVLLYLKGKTSVPKAPLDLRGTDFQKRVWKALQRIPNGKTRSYQEVAKAAGNEKAVRAVGMANNKNPLPLFIPCHRVIGKNGDLVGFGCGLPLKKKLLNLEARL